MHAAARAQHVRCARVDPGPDVPARRDRGPSADSARSETDSLLRCYPKSDDEGREFADVEAARAMTQRALVDMAGRLIPDGERRAFTAAIREGNGTVLYIATLTLSGEWKASPSPEHLPSDATVIPFRDS